MKYDPAVEPKRIKGLVLIINGKHDIQVATGEADSSKTALPNVQLALFEKMKH